MEAPTPVFWLNSLSICLILGSIAVWLPLAVRWNNEGVLLPYEQRQRVPWRFVGALPAILFVIMAVVNALASKEQGADVDLQTVLWSSIATGVVLLGMVIAASAAILFVERGNLGDLGLPSSRDQCCNDVALGAIAWLAALLPVFIVQWASTAALGEESQNPVINQLKDNTNWRVFVAAIISAVVVAPIFEEFVFRLLFQGWLERVEDQAIGFHATERTALALSQPLCEIIDNAGLVDVDNAPLIESTPTRGLLPGIAHGYVPIALSSLLFSLAHIGFGPDPIALFVLAVMLGYVYQRTHRIVPCIVVHALFNALNLLILWLVLRSEPA